MSSRDLIIETPTSRHAPTATGRARVAWDWPVRVFHWALVAAFAGAYVTHRLGPTYFEYHAWCGYAVIVLVLFRLAWGIVGSRYARFVNFVRGPLTTWRYARRWLTSDAPHTQGHNPLGAWMVLLLLVLLSAQGVTGLFANDDIMNLGPLYGYVSAELSATLSSLHRRAFYWIAAAVAVHVLAVVVHVVLKKDNVLGSMLPRRSPTLEKMAVRSWLAVVLLGASAALLVMVIATAPSAVLPE